MIVKVAKFQFLLSAVLLFGSLSLFAQEKEQVLMTIDNKPVYKSEFVSIFKKNNREEAVTKEALDEYIDLFVNFKLKVTEAENLGYDTLTSFVNELGGYRKQLAKPYLTDSKLTDELIQEAYSRLTEEVKASHILIKVDRDAKPEDTVKAYNKAKMIIGKLKKGEDFSKLAVQYSEDPSAKANRGDLGFFTGLTMVYAFETAAYTTPVGEFTANPVRTAFGYHILKVEDRRKARGQVQVAHILVKSMAADDKAELAAAESKVQEIYDLVKQGQDFSELARKYSEDKTTANVGGVLPMFGTGKMVETFEDVAFSLTKEGEVSEPFRTNYGWHIVKLVKKKPLEPFEDMKSQLTRRISRDERAQLTRESFVNSMKEEYGFKEYKNNLKTFYSILDTSYFNARWEIPKRAKLTRTLFVFADKKYTQEDFANYLLDIQRKRRNETIKSIVPEAYGEFVAKTVIDFEDGQLEGKYPEFKALMKEYRDGILLFDLTNKKVWNKAVEDTTGLKAFYEETKENYMWKKRIRYTLIKCNDEKVAKKALKLTKKDYTPDEIRAKLKIKSSLELIDETAMEQEGEDETLDKFEWKKGLSEIKNIDGQFTFLNISEVLEPTPKKLSEARGAITAAYQNYLEEQWIKELRNKYKFKVDQNVLYSVK